MKKNKRRRREKLYFYVVYDQKGHHGVEYQHNIKCSIASKLQLQNRFVEFMLSLSSYIVSYRQPRVSRQIPRYESCFHITLFGPDPNPHRTILRITDLIKLCHEKRIRVQSSIGIVWWRSGHGFMRVYLDFGRFNLNWERMICGNQESILSNSIVVRVENWTGWNQETHKIYRLLKYSYIRVVEVEEHD